MQNIEAALIIPPLNRSTGILNQGLSIDVNTKVLYSLKLHIRQMNKRSGAKELFHRVPVIYCLQYCQLEDYHG